LNNRRGNSGVSDARERLASRRRARRRSTEACESLLGPSRGRERAGKVRRADDSEEWPGRGAGSIEITGRVVRKRPPLSRRNRRRRLQTRRISARAVANSLGASVVFPARAAGERVSKSEKRFQCRVSPRQPRGFLPIKAL
jgi:hypothetical protein